MEKNDNKNVASVFHAGRESLSISDAAKKLDTFIDENPDASYLSKKAYQSQYFQFLWMYTEGFSEDFISRLALSSPPLTLTTIHVLGCLALLFGEEFAFQFWGKDFSSFDVQNALAEKYANSSVPGVDDAKELAAELPRAREHFDTNLDFLKCALEYVEQQRKDTKLFYDEYINEIKSSSQKYEDMSAEAAAARKEAEIQKLTDDLEACRKDLARKTEEYEVAVRERDEADKTRDSAVSERDSALKKLNDFKKEDTGSNAAVTNRRRPFFRRKRDDKKEELLDEVFLNKDKDIAEVIADAFDKGLSYKGLKKLYEANAPIENIKALKMYMLQRELGIIDDEGEEK